jgi:hypothetical protein
MMTLLDDELFKNFLPKESQQAKPLHVTSVSKYYQNCYLIEILPWSYPENAIKLNFFKNYQTGILDVIGITNCKVPFMTIILYFTCKVFLLADNWDCTSTNKSKILKNFEVRTILWTP